MEPVKNVPAEECKPDYRAGRAGSAQGRENQSGGDRYDEEEIEREERDDILLAVLALLMDKQSTQGIVSHCEPDPGLPRSAGEPGLFTVLGR